MKNVQEELNKVFEENQHSIENPLWKIVDGQLVEPKYVHDYERYIPEIFKYEWSDLTNNIKTSLFIVAEKAANNECWE